MSGRIFIALVAIFLLSGEALLAQRPHFGFGLGGGVVLGSQLADQGFVSRIDDQDVQFLQKVELDQVVVASGHLEWYVLPKLALRLHGAWGRGRLEVDTFFEDGGEWEAGGFEDDYGHVKIRALDAGLSFWPWTPRTVGFAPFLTVGIGSFGYTFEDLNGAQTFFHATGTRSGRAVLVGLGADMHVWRSIMLRMEAVNHLVDSPLQATDFSFPSPGTSGGIDDRISNVRLVLGAHFYLPFRTMDDRP